METMRWVVWWIVATAACGHPHVTFPPMPDLGPTERVQAYMALRPVSEKVVTSRNAVQVTMTLANGTEVWHATDLEPLVAPASKTAQALTHFRAASARQRTWRNVALATIPVTILVEVGLANLDMNATVLGGAALLGVGTFLVSILGSAWNRRTAVYAHLDALETFDESLAQRLNVCVSGLGVVPCENAQPATLPADDPAIGGLRQR